MANLDALEAKVTEVSDTAEAVVVLLEGVIQQLRDAGGSPARIDAVIAQLETAKARMAAAVVAGTDGDPETPAA